MSEFPVNAEEAAERVRKGLAEIARLLARQAAREAHEQERKDAGENPDPPRYVP